MTTEIKKPVQKAMEEIDAVLEKYGIGSYAMIMRDPDSHQSFSVYDGAIEWIYGALILKAKQLENAWLTEGTVEDEKPPEGTGQC